MSESVRTQRVALRTIFFAFPRISLAACGMAILRKLARSKNHDTDLVSANIVHYFR